MSAAATARHTVTPPSIFARPVIPSSKATIRRKGGDGAMSMKLVWTLDAARPRVKDQSRGTISSRRGESCNNGYFMYAGNERFLRQSDIKVEHAVVDRAAIDKRGSCSDSMLTAGSEIPRLSSW